MSKKQKRYLNDPWHTAIHEAGHAVIARVLDKLVTLVTIVETDEYRGCVTTDDHPTITVEEWRRRVCARERLRPRDMGDGGVRLRAQIISAMAAAEAEKELLGHYSGEDWDDRNRIEYIAESRDAFSSDEEWERYEPRMRRQARRLIRKHRDKIERVANALLERKTLQPEEIDALMKHVG